jgi:hypothetical protein
VENCHVKIVDESGNEFVFTEISKGKYVADIDDALLYYNVQYKLVFSTPSGENYESGFQRILKTAPVDSIYFIREEHYNPESEYLNIEGLQFYVDLDAPDDAARYYRWQIDETWEIHTYHKIDGVYDGTTIKLFVFPSDSLYNCWNTRSATGIYTSSTIALAHNIIKKIPLHYKSKYSEDLIIKYCATVKQFALNKDAYEYWHQKEIELNESGQIYVTQPNQLNSNISNINNPEEKVLGFFWASSTTKKHVFVKNNPFNILGTALTNCKSIIYVTDLSDQALINFLLTIIKSRKDLPQPPFYIYFTPTADGRTMVAFAKDECTDCRMIAGSNHKPDFWE